MHFQHHHLAMVRYHDTTFWADPTEPSEEWPKTPRPTPVIKFRAANENQTVDEDDMDGKVGCCCRPKKAGSTTQDARPQLSRKTTTQSSNVIEGEKRDSMVMFPLRPDHGSFQNQFKRH